MNRNIESILSDIDKTEDKRYLKRIRELYYNEETPIRILRSVFNERCAINQYLTNDDVEGKDLDTLFFENKKGAFRKRWYYFDEAFQSWKSTIIYEDEYTTINKPTSFEESRNIGNPQWCFCYKNDKWLQHNQEFKETIYFIHCVIQPEIWQYNAVCVLPNNGMKILDSNHRYLSRNGEIDGYLYTLGEKAVSVIISDKSIINESKNYKNMKKNVQRINESQLKAIIAESVKKVLNEIEASPRKRSQYQQELINQARLDNGEYNGKMPIDWIDNPTKYSYDDSGKQRINWNEPKFSHPQKYDARGFGTNGKHKETGTRKDPEGYNRLGFDGPGTQGYNRNGRDIHGYDREGYDLKGRDKEGYDKEGFKNGFNREGFNKKGYNKKGINKDGYDKNNEKIGKEKITNLIENFCKENDYLNVKVGTANSFFKGTIYMLSTIIS